VRYWKEPEVSESVGADNADLRVSDSEREHVLSLLLRAMERGMITTGELEERSAAVATARTRRELNSLVADLATSRDLGRNCPEAPRRSETVELRGWLSSVKRKGEWQVPRKLVLTKRLASVELDFTKTRIDHPEIEIELDVIAGSVEIRLPENASVSVDDVQVILGSIEDHRRSPLPAGQPHVILTGTLRCGSLEVRGPRRSLFTRG
jgi:hypothetical protein